MFGTRKQQQAAPGTDRKVCFCSFCNKSQHDVKRLIAGPKVYICDECVDICLDIVSEDRKDAQIETDRPSAATLTHCLLCHLPTTAEQGTYVTNRGILCPGCVGEIEAALARRGGEQT